MNTSRRGFLRASGGAALFSIVPRYVVAGSGVVPPSETVTMLSIGAGDPAWTFIPNTGKGSFELREVEGVKAGAVKWDFAGSRAKGVPYVMASVPVNVEAGTAIHLQACSSVAQKLTFRVKDSTDQTLQFKTKIAPGAWSDMKFPLSKKLEHWDGANDGVVHFPVKSIAMSIPMPADATSGETLFSNFSVR